jgi:hypothetical protein
MLRRYQSDPRVFLDTARKHGAAVRVVTDARVIPRAQGTAVVMQPVILLHYVFSFEEGGEEQTWTYEEFLDDKGGKVSIATSLLDDIYKDDQLRERVVVSDRTMALPPRT